MLLTRSTRICLPTNGIAPTRVGNALEGRNSPEEWVFTTEFEVTLSGNADPTTGYIVGIQHIDAAVRSEAPPLIVKALAEGKPPASILVDLQERLEFILALPVTRLLLRQHSFSSIAIETTMQNQAILTQRFDFSASHRLHCPSLDDATNARVFGKCNNPAGHGHNYRLEVEVIVPLAQTLRCEDLDRLIREHAIDRLDHKHLNSDVPEFRSANPSVETIAKVCFEWLGQPIATVGGSLRRVRLWETEKTSAIYPE